MTLTEFTEHLKSQPWELDYVANLLYSNYPNDYSVVNFINVFSWSNCPNRSASFWAGLHTGDFYINTSSHISRAQFVQIIEDIYSQTHPELFI